MNSMVLTFPRLERVDRFAGLNPWVVGLGAMWLALVLIGIVIERVLGETLSLCLFRRFFDIPCGTCGTTRLTLALGRGSVLEALQLNPLMSLLLPALLLIGIIRFGFGRRLNWGVNSHRAQWGWWVFLAAFGLNWLYVLLTIPS